MDSVGSPQTLRDALAVLALLEKLDYLDHTVWSV
jgi:hypothetical protein